MFHTVVVVLYYYTILCGRTGGTISRYKQVYNTSNILLQEEGSEYHSSQTKNFGWDVQL